MADQLDIQNLLQKGYFTANRTSAENSRSQPPSPRVSSSSPTWRDVPRSYDDKPVRLSSFSRAPLIEDEADSLAREYPTTTLPPSSGLEEAPSRGDVEQQPIILEVHEHNPERRFVILPDAQNDSNKASSDGEKAKKPRRLSQSQVDGTRRYDPVFDERPGDKNKPTLERRKSRQDLPPIETNLRPDRRAEHHRTRSAVGGSRPDFFVSTPPRGAGLLSPEVTKYGSRRQDKPYYGYGQDSYSTNRPSLRRTHSDDKKGEGSTGYSKDRSRGSSSSKRPNPSADEMRSSRQPSTDKEYREDYSTPRTHRRDGSKRYVRGDVESTSASSRSRAQESRTPRDDSRSSDEYSRSTRTSGRRRGDSLVVQGNRELKPDFDVNANGDRGGRSRSRDPRMSASAPKTSVPGADVTPVSARTATLPIVGKERSDSRKPQLPYPDDDEFFRAQVEASSGNERAANAKERTPTIVSMPMFPSMPPTDIVAESAATAEQSVTTPSTSKSWQPPQFDPDKDGVQVDRPVGSYRRYSENLDKQGPQQLPECRRTKPEAGFMDWLTLPRTDFNICPSCYESCFADSQFRTHFQPVLRSSDQPIACDFGSSPWFRIAWLLMRRGQLEDLRLFHKLDAVASASRHEPCPGDRKTTRTWLTIVDPYTRRPIPDFTVCYRCAKTIETIFPVLDGTFVSFDPRLEPTRGVCALHFKPHRKEFILYVDALETTADKAMANDQKPNMTKLTQDLQKVCLGGKECQEDNPVIDGYWHVMQYLPQFTVCAKCFDEVVRPKLNDDNTIARNFYMKPQKLANATCQLYSTRMREVFKKACRYNDPKYLEGKVNERLDIEADIHAKLVKLDKTGANDEWTTEQVSKLVREWKRWE